MKGSQIKPLFDYVLIKPLEAEARTPSGILLAESAKEKPQMGEVMAVGPGKESCSDGCEECQCGAMIVKKGMHVLYKKWGGNEIKVENKEWLLGEQKEIMAIVNEK